MFTTLYSPWLIPVCLLAGAGYAAILYYSHSNSESFGFTTALRLWLAILRGLAIALIAFLLLSPMLRSVIRRTEKPIVVIAADNSQSILANKDSTYYRTELRRQLEKLAEAAGSRFDVRTYSFSDKLRSGLNLDFSGKQTNMGLLFDEIRDKFTNRNLAAVIVSGDGLYTSGNDPLYAAEGVPYSIYTIALGDTSQQKDLNILRVNFNRTVLLRNNFPVEVSFGAHQFSGKNTSLTIFTGEEKLAQTDLVINGNDETRTQNFILKATKPGMQKFRIVLKSLPGEISIRNNVYEFVVEVLDARQKVLILGASPHPDLSAIRQSVEENKNYEADLQLLSDFNGNAEKYNLVILHQVPGKTDAANQVLSQLKNSEIPVLYILGSQSNIPAFNSLLTGVVIPGTTASPAAAFASFNDNFSLFTLNSENIRRIQGFPPLNVPFGNYTVSPSIHILFSQRIGSVTTPYPLIMFSQGIGRRTGIIAGEGLWRWRLDDFMKNGNHEAFNELISKTIQFLSIKVDKSRFRVLHKSYFKENEPVLIDAELYNESFELINDPDVNMVITDASNHNYPFTFTRNSNAYFLEAGSFPPGDYRYKAKTNFRNEIFEKSGTFSILALNEETMNTVANHSLLQNLATLHHGELLYPSQMDQIVDKLVNREDIRSVVYSEKRFTDLVNIFLVLAIIVLLLATEWFLRKRNGSY